MDNKRFWIYVGAGAGALLLVAISFSCVVGILIYAVWGGGSGQKLVGQWEGKVDFLGHNAKVTVEFKSNGRFSAVDGLGDTWTGTWKVKLKEGNDYHLNLVYDSEPDRVKGWTVTFKDDDTIILNGFIGVPPTLKRQK
jgi:hypothetical protein